MMTPGHATPTHHRSFLAPLFVSGALVVPPFVLEVVNRRTFHEELPLLLFAFMSVHALVIALLLTPVLRRFHADGSLRALTGAHWARLLLGVFLGYVYVGVIVDQLPCFLGVPNCD